jgi:hypothetical protein
VGRILFPLGDRFFACQVAGKPKKHYFFMQFELIEREDAKSSCIFSITTS